MTKDPEALEWVSKAAHWFGDEFKSYKWIARQFNAHRVSGHVNWTGSHIRQILSCPIYIGVVIFNRTRAVLDSETGELTIENNPHSKWVIKVIPELRAWDDELWKKVRRQAAYVRNHAPGTGKKYRARELHPVALLLGTLICGSCKREHNLIRSTNSYKQYGCPIGCQVPRRRGQ